jgi:hypothetical protein
MATKDHNGILYADIRGSAESAADVLISILQFVRF